MINADDIKLLVASGEGYNAEFKISVPSKVKELSEEICAFANASGGVLLIGVNDANEIKGVQIDNTKRSAIQNSIQEITPHLSCSLSFVDVDGQNIGVIEVPSGANKPYILSGAIYVRIGPNTQKLKTAEQMLEFFQKSDRVFFDEAPCIGFEPLTMIDEAFLTQFKAESNINNTVQNEQIFKNLKFITNENHFKNGAALFFGKKPQDWIDQSILRCVAFQGLNKRFIIDDKPFEGNLYNQFQQAMQWLKGKLNVRYDIEGQGSKPRKEIWEIPETVFKEAIVNALSHRDYYDKGSVINIEVFDDRVEISNPGGLVSAIPEAEFGKRSHTRNPLIFGLFARMHIVEQVGSGINRMKALMLADNLPEPVFLKEGIFTVILQRPIDSRIKTTRKTTQKTTRKTTQKTAQKTAQKTEDRIIEILDINPEATRSEIAELLENISDAGVKYQLNKLKRQGKIERIGSDRGGIWKIIKQ